MNPHEKLENELRGEFRREDAPQGFAEKVLAHTVKRPRTIVPFWRHPATLAMAAGLAVAALVPSTVTEYQRRETARGLEARRELLVAFNITKIKLQQTKERIQRVSRHTL